MWGLSSPTRDGTCVPCITRCSLTTGPPGKTLCCFLMSALKEARKDELYPSFHPDSPSMTSLFCPPLTPPPTMLLRPWLESSEASWQSAFIWLPPLARLPTLLRITVLLLLLSPQRTGSPGVGHSDFPGHPTFLGTSSSQGEEEGKAGGDTVCFLFCFLVSFWLWSKAPGCEAHPRAVWSRFLLTKGTARLCCGQSPEFTFLS